MAATQTDIIYLSPSQLKTVTTTIIKTGEPLWIHGEPGCGKTSVISQAFEELGMPVCWIPPPPTMESVDVRGLPKITKKDKYDVTAWALADFWPRDEDWEGGIVLDEFPQGAREVQAAFSQAIPVSKKMRGRLGDYLVPKGARFVATGNRQEDRAGANKVLSHLLNRFIHIGLAVSNDDWQSWAVDNEIAPEVRSFLRFRPNLLRTFDPKIYQLAYASPRSWERASHIVKSKLGFDWSESDEKEGTHGLFNAALSGCVGMGPAAEFCAYVKTYLSLPDLDYLVANPEKANVPKDPSLLWALCGALSERCRKSDDKNLNQIVSYLLRMPGEFTMMAMRDSAQINKRILNSNYVPNARPFLKKHMHVLVPGASAT